MFFFVDLREKSYFVLFVSFVVRALSLLWLRRSPRWDLYG
jgi:hypothetical protein